MSAATETATTPAETAPHRIYYSWTGCVPQSPWMPSPAFLFWQEQEIAKYRDNHTNESSQHWRSESWKQTLAAKRDRAVTARAAKAEKAKLKIKARKAREAEKAKLKARAAKARAKSKVIKLTKPTKDHA